MLNALRWVLILPAAVVGQIAGAILMRMLNADTFDAFPFNLIGGHWILNALATGGAAVLFVVFGSRTAPSHGVIVAWVLAIFILVASIWEIKVIVTLPGFALGAQLHLPRPWGLGPETHPAWWEILSDTIWAVAACSTAWYIRHEEHKTVSEADQTPHEVEGVDYDYESS